MINKIKEKLKTNKMIYKIIYKFKNYVNKMRSGIRGSSNVIKNKSIISNIKYDIIGNSNSIYIHDESRIFNLKIFIRGNNHKIIIGKNCIIKSGSIWIEDENCTLEIGNSTTIEDAHFGITEPNSTIKVGNDCMFSYGIKLLTGDSHSIIDLNTMKRINYANNIKIEEHVWIGADVVILKGVNIAKNSIIGSRSIVTKNHGPNVIIAGSPAKIIKENITWDRERIYI